MQGSANLLIDAETVIVNLLLEDQKNYLPLSRLEGLIDFIYKQLEGSFFSEEATVIFDVSFDAIERTVQYKNNIFALIGETIYLKTSIQRQNIQEKTDQRIVRLIKDFCKKAA